MACSLSATTQVGDGVKWPLQGEVLAGVRSRLNLPFHGGSVDPSGRAQRFLSCASTENTLRCVGDRSTFSSVFFSFCFLFSCFFLFFFRFVFFFSDDFLFVMCVSVSCSVRRQPPEKKLSCVASPAALIRVLFSRESVCLHPLPRVRGVVAVGSLLAAQPMLSEEVHFAIICQVLL